MSYPYHYEIKREKKGNVLYRVERKRRVALAVDSDGLGLPQLNRMKALLDMSKLPIRELRKAEDGAAIPKKGRVANWATNGASQRSL
jgi:hypothetical protein